MTTSKNYRNLLIGDGFSAFGSWIDFLAILTLAAYYFKVNAFQMGLVSAAALLPGILLAKRIGRLCDTANPRTILQWSIVGRLALTIAIVLSGEFAIFLLLVATRSIFTSVAPPAINVLAVRSLQDEERPRFYAALNVLNNAAKIIAPSIGTITSSISSEATALLISAACSLCALVFFQLLPSVKRAPAADDTEAPAPAAAATGNFGVLLYVAASYALFVFMVNNLVPLALQRSGFDKSILGLLISCSGAGNILSGLWLAKRNAAAKIQGAISEVAIPASLQAFGFLAIGLALLQFEHSAQLILPVLFFVIGTFSARYAITCNIYLTKHYSSSIGAASSAMQGWQNAMILIAPMLGAIVLDQSGPGELFIFAGATGLAAYAALLLRVNGFGRTQPLGVEK